MGDPERLINRRDAAFGAGAPLFYDEPLHIVRGEGVYLFDADGKRYVDLYNNVPGVGHANPRVTEAVSSQMATLNVHSRYIHQSAIAFAERFTALHTLGIESVVFSCSGTEANEVAIRMARIATGHEGIICSNGAYHGNSTLLSMLTHVGRTRPETETVRAFPFPDLYRPIQPGLDPDQFCELYLSAVSDKIKELKNSTAGFAGLVVCSIFANEGLPNLPPHFMAKCRDLVHAAGGLMIVDEIQAGYGRTGRWWGYETSGFTPDIVTTGKAMGNGVPLAATAASRKLVETFRAATRYFNTFAASPLQAAAGMAVLDVVEQENLIEHAAVIGSWLKAELASRIALSPVVGDVRGQGLFVGVEIINPDDGSPAQETAVRICNRLKDKGFLTSSAGVLRNVIKIRPPLVLERVHGEGFLAAWDAVMENVSA
ncbi:MAG TPA: aminotransferase class III-fold pyridoxal phosphate-dependent enzyme [Hyphomonadaceae bacterium]|nr:aminotransferase class III-fold pyridoxal phosphate-dependent enzyme [Hyphomonadaceae bacterium]HPN04186.1 aminotransferase class III-fold pyridoxal phosphate-dependent enzyme [Hyphomonadaceae bacterium]